ncbi:ExbD/TolR family protein [Oligosphaera ethanolica]|jgi:biopolymer transport protein ExbD|uniref:Biopolymer transport protein ExbD n=1 Tax=Oligosphaera ethanolica TaxID=760260 RepID=A0AAE3VDH0_9BACT|nr:biopolymer transporter ExbD [Oligosphaera ethanolica]MDQ0288502.1 biopolymer transport protein ExbD [Oligosphaera ethanolica]
MKHFRQMENIGGEPAEINMSPLVDMVFLLLIFFMVTTVFVQETGVDVNKPQAASAESLAQNSILLALTTDGRVVHGGQEVSMNRLRSLVSGLLQAKDMPVIILADERSQTGLLVQLIDQCKLAGARDVSVAATKE